MTVKQNLKLVILLVLALLFFIFIVQNVAIVEVKFLFWSIQLSRSLLMVLLVLLGMIMAWAIGGVVRYRKAHSK